MRVPVYQPHISYQQTLARNVRLAQPLREASGRKEWTDLQSIAGLMESAYALPTALNQTAEAFASSQNQWEKEWAEVSRKISGPTQAKRQESAAEQIKAASAVSGKQEQAQKASWQAKAETKNAFSSAARAQQLRFARDEVFSSTPAAVSGAEAGANTSAVERLDEKFISLFSEEAQVPGAAESLLAQDYVILRQEIENLEDKSRRFQAQQNIQQGAASFVQTAALVRTPRALENYMQDNLASAAQEARRAGIEEKEWKAKSQMLLRQAVRHNVEAALEAGEADRAEKMYRHFSSRLLPQEQTLLQHKLTSRRADLLAEKLWPAARQLCTDEKGRIDEKSLASFTTQHTTEEDKDFQQELSSCLQARLAQSYRRDLLHRAAGYQRLLHTTATEDLACLMLGDEFSAQDLYSNRLALHRLQCAPQQSSSAPVFNRLYQAILSGQADENATEKALRDGALSARDYWRLKKHTALAQAAETDGRARLLCQALTRFCRQNELSAQESEEVRYFVFTAGESVPEQIQAAHTVKNIFLLQENK